VNRTALGEHQRRQRALVVGVDDVAGVDQPHAHAPIARRGDGGVLKLGLRGLDHRLVGCDRGLELIDLGLLLIDDLLRGDVRKHQCLRAREVLLGRGQLRLVLRLLGLGLIERGLEQARIDLGQHVALFHMLAFREQHLLQLAVDLRMDRDGERRLHRAEPGQVDRHVLPADDRHAHRHPRARGRACRMGRLRPGHGIPVNGCSAAGQGCEKGSNQSDAAAARRCSSALYNHNCPLATLHIEISGQSDGPANYGFVGRDLSFVYTIAIAQPRTRFPQGR
jgi:hypothetical protein